MENKIKELEEKLLRKEQECKVLKEDEKSLLNVIDDLQKTKNEWQEKYNDLGQDFDQLKVENEGLKKKINSLLCSKNCYKYKQAEKLKQTLIQIKDIAENVQSFAGRIDIEDDVFEQMEQILQKISEMNHDL